MLGMKYKGVMAHRAPTIDACFTKAILAFGPMVYGDNPLVIPTVIHFAPLLRARLLRLWRDRSLRLWTFIF